MVLRYKGFKPMQQIRNFTHNKKDAHFWTSLYLLSKSGWGWVPQLASLGR